MDEFNAHVHEEIVQHENTILPLCFGCFGIL